MPKTKTPAPVLTAGADPTGLGSTPVGPPAPQDAAGPGDPTSGFLAVDVPLESLTPHPRNYKTHPPDQVEHICQSLSDHGFYKNVVVGRGDVILAGHGVVTAARKLGHATVPVVRVDLDPDDPDALKILVGDNEVAHLAGQNDRLLTELLRGVKDRATGGLKGTGYDDKMLAALVMVTRHESEIKDFNAAAEWVGMPGYTPGDETLKITVSFRSQADRQAFLDRLGIALPETARTTWFPPRERDDLASVRFEG